MLALQEGQLLRSTCVSPAIALVRATPEVCPLGGDVDPEHPVATRSDVLPARGVRPRAGSLPMEARRYTG